MTNFATFIDTGNDKRRSPSAARRSRNAQICGWWGWAWSLTRDGGIPLAWHAYPGDKPDVTQFPAMIGTLAGRHADLHRQRPGGRGDHRGLGAGRTGRQLHPPHRIGTALLGSVPASDCGDLLALPASARAIVDEARFGGLTAVGARREVYGAERRAILTHSPELHAAQAAGFTGTTLAKAARRLDQLPLPSPGAKPPGPEPG